MPVLSLKLYTSDFGLHLLSTMNNCMLLWNKLVITDSFLLIFAFYLKDNKLFKTNLLLKETIAY